MSNVRSMRDPRKRWVMHFYMQMDDGTLLPVMLCYDPDLRERLVEIRSAFAEAGPAEVSTWWERSSESKDDIHIGVEITSEETEGDPLELWVPLTLQEWAVACQRAAAAGRDTVLMSLTGNPAVLQLQEDPTSWEAEVPLAEAIVWDEVRQSADWEG